MIRYRCPVCKVEAEIDKKKKEVVLHLPPLEMPKSIERFHGTISACFPSHFDCELFKPVNEIDLKKLVKVEAKSK